MPGFVDVVHFGVAGAVLSDVIGSVLRERAAPAGCGEHQQDQAGDMAP